MARKRGGERVVWPGFTYGPEQRRIIKVGRNDKCPCGSDKKYKECHEKEGSAWLEKLAMEQAEKRWREERDRRRQEQGPWYKRLLFWR